MARVENTTSGVRELHALRSINEHGSVGPFVIPRAETVVGVKTNGVCDIPDAILDEMIAKDGVTKGLFEAGDLVRVGKSESPKADPSADANQKNPKAK